jgi:epoxyqueuosine reductase QueG
VTGWVIWIKNGLPENRSYVKLKFQPYLTISLYNKHSPTVTMKWGGLSMNTVNSDEVKQRARELGAALCGIASAGGFGDAPAGFRPSDIMKECESVIVLAVRFPVSALTSTPAAYTFARNQVCAQLDSITFQLAVELEGMGKCAIAIPSAEPYEYWDETRQHGRGIMSLKHAAVLAGLGKIGKNTLLVNDQFGNMLWLGMLLVNEKLDLDPSAAYEACIPNCRICLDACPVGALDGTTIDQAKCRSISGKCTDGGGFIYSCNLCRKICPNYKGVEA